MQIEMNYECTLEKQLVQEMEGISCSKVTTCPTNVKNMLLKINNLFSKWKESVSQNVITYLVNRRNLLLKSDNLFSKWKFYS